MRLRLRQHRHEHVEQLLMEKRRVLLNHTPNLFQTEQPHVLVRLIIEEAVHDAAEVLLQPLRLARVDQLCLHRRMLQHVQAQGLHIRRLSPPPPPSTTYLTS